MRLEPQFAASPSVSALFVHTLRRAQLMIVSSTCCAAGGTALNAPRAETNAVFARYYFGAQGRPWSD